MDDLINSIIEGDVIPAVPAPIPKTRRRCVVPAARVVPTEDAAQALAPTTTSQVHRDTLAALVAGGQTEYLDHDKIITSTKIDAATSPEIEVLFARYELKLGAALTQSLGSTLIRLYTKVASIFLPIPPEEQKELATDLENDSFLEHTLNSTMCILYHNFSTVIAPLTVALTTMKHCQFQKPNTPVLEPQQQTEIRDGGSDSPQKGP